MANQRGTFAKRQREADLKEKARAKLARRMAKRSEVRTTKGPEMGEAVVLEDEPFDDIGSDEAGSDEAGSDEAASDEVAPAARPTTAVPTAAVPRAATVPATPGTARNAGPSDPTK
jgi:hypothetical protein